MNPLYIIAAVLAFRAIQKKKAAPVRPPAQGSDIETPTTTAKGAGVSFTTQDAPPPTGAGGQRVVVIQPDGTEIEQVIPL